MSSTDSLVVKAPRAGPICRAHSSTSAPNVLSVALSSARSSLNTGQLSGLDRPVPRWSKISRSRVVSAGAIAFASCSESGSAACPGPPARARTALWVWVAAAAFRSTLSALRPGVSPLRSSVTGRVAQVRPVLFGQALNVSAAATGTCTGARRPHSAAAAGMVVSVRLDIQGHVSGRGGGRGAVGAPADQRRAAFSGGGFDDADGVPPRIGKQADLKTLVPLLRPHQARPAEA